MDKKELQRRAGIITEQDEDSGPRGRGPIHDERTSIVWETRAKLADALRSIRRLSGPGIQEISQDIDNLIVQIESLAGRMRK